jgi:tRNA-Thr(GGU) m(6)t(6)A37 methyltransferase TsaA
VETTVEINPIAVFRTRKKHPYEAARQGSIETSDEIGELHFQSGQQFEQALDQIEGFSHLWLIYLFHHNTAWKPKVLPPRGSSQKVGVFATRSPYRPNPIGLSCVEFLERDGLILRVRNFDLLDETPILDVKPYLHYSDSFPAAKMGWLEGVEDERLTVHFSSLALAQLGFLAAKGLTELQNFLVQQLSFEPLNAKKKRVSLGAGVGGKPAMNSESGDEAILAYRTWRAGFRVSGRAVEVLRIFSGYSSGDLSESVDTYQDKSLHRNFISQFGSGT